MSTVDLRKGNCLALMRDMADNSVDSIVCDPPYELGFMGKSWDSSGVACNIEVWREAGRILKPGGHLIAFSGTRTYHRMVVAIEDAGFEVRDQLGWMYGSGFPKSRNISKDMDDSAGATREVVGTVERPAFSKGRGHGINADGTPVYKGVNGGHEGTIEHEVTVAATDAAKQWDGWGTALKPAWEPAVLARKPLEKGLTVAANVLKWGTGALNIDGCRIEGTPADGGTGSTWNTLHQHEGRAGEASAERRYSAGGNDGFALKPGPRGGAPEGRWPANLLLSYPADEYCLRDDVTPCQLEELAGWLRENA